MGRLFDDPSGAEFTSLAAAPAVLDPLLEYTEQCVTALRLGQEPPAPPGRCAAPARLETRFAGADFEPLRCWLASDFEQDRPCPHGAANWIDCTQCGDFRAAQASPEARLLETVHALAGEIAQRRQEMGLLRGLLDRSEDLARLGQQVGSVAHELNNIVGSIMGYAQLAKLTGEDQDVRKLIDVALAATARAKTILLGLRSATRLKKKTGIQHVPDLLDMVVAHVSRDMGRDRIVVHREYSDVPWVITDSMNLQRVFLSICTQLARDMDDGGRIDLGIRHRGEWIEIRIAGEATGADGVSRQLTFDEFLPPTREARPFPKEALRENQEIVSELGGKLHARRGGRNSTVFTVKLPLA
jgi:K+-sensing histidine kinase KdpD